VEAQNLLVAISTFRIPAGNADTKRNRFTAADAVRGTGESTGKEIDVQEKAARAAKQKDDQRQAGNRY